MATAGDSLDLLKPNEATSLRNRPNSPSSPKQHTKIIISNPDSSSADLIEIQNPTQPSGVKELKKEKTRKSRPERDKMRDYQKDSPAAHQFSSLPRRTIHLGEGELILDAINKTSHSSSLSPDSRPPPLLSHPDFHSHSNSSFSSSSSSSSSSFHPDSIPSPSFQRHSLSPLIEPRLSSLQILPQNNQNNNHNNNQNNNHNTNNNNNQIRSEPLFNNTALNFDFRNWKRTLTFPNQAVEHHFLSSYHPKAVFMVRFISIVILIATLLVGITDLSVENMNSRQEIYIIRYGILTPLCLFYLYFTRSSLFFSHRYFITSLYCLLIGFGFIIISALGGEINYATYMILFDVYALFMCLSYAAANLVNWTLLIGFNFINWYIGQEDESHQSNWALALGFLIATNLSLMGIGYSIEIACRSAFLQMQRLRTEQHKTNVVLYNILPKNVAQRLVRNVRSADYYPCVTILFCDIWEFKSLTALLPAKKLVFLLNQVFSLFDRITDKHDVLKIETIGEVYMVASGLPEEIDRHAEACAYLALDMLAESTSILIPEVTEDEQLQMMIQQQIIHGSTKGEMGGEGGGGGGGKGREGEKGRESGIFQYEAEKRWKKKVKASRKPIVIRIGIHTGDCTAGVIGAKLPRYRLFGDTVNGNKFTTHNPHTSKPTHNSSHCIEQSSYSSDSSNHFRLHHPYYRS